MTNLFSHLDAPAKPREVLPHNRSATSRDAAESKAASGTTSSDRNRISVFLVMAGPDGATRHQIADMLGIDIGSVCGRCAELMGNSPSYLAAGGEPVLMPKLDAEGKPVRRVWRDRKSAEVVIHRLHQKSNT